MPRPRTKPRPKRPTNRPPDNRPGSKPKRARSAAEIAASFPVPDEGTANRLIGILNPETDGNGEACSYKAANSLPRSSDEQTIAGSASQHLEAPASLRD